MKQLCKRRRRCVAAGGSFRELGDQSGEKHLCSSRGSAAGGRRERDAAAQEVLSARAPAAPAICRRPCDCRRTNAAQRRGRRTTTRRADSEPMAEGDEGASSVVPRRPDAPDACCTPLLRKQRHVAAARLLVRRRRLHVDEPQLGSQGPACSPSKAAPARRPAFKTWPVSPALVRSSRSTSCGSTARSPAPTALARVTLGRFLFRDVSNRDHTAEVTYLRRRQAGSKSRSSHRDTPTHRRRPAGTDPGQRLHRPRQPVVRRRRRMASTTKPSSNSIEGNYVVKSRMGRDQMVLQPGRRMGARRPTPRRPTRSWPACGT